MTHPHRQNQSDIPDAINGKHLYRILNGQIPVAVERDKQEGRDPQDFPSDEQGFEVARKNDECIAKVKKEDRVEKTFVSAFAVHVVAAVDRDQKGQEGAHEQVHRRDLVKIKVDEKLIPHGFENNNVFDVECRVIDVDPNQYENEEAH